MTHFFIFKLPPEFKAKWLSDLRSGSIKQGQHVLRSTEDCYCCLGVACNILNSNAWHSAKYTGKWMWADGHAMPDGLVLELNHKQISDCLRQPIPEGVGNFCALRNVEGYLAGLNDAGKTFAAIADWIEEHL